MRTKSIRFTLEEYQILRDSLFALRDKYYQKIDATSNEESKEMLWDKILTMSKMYDDIYDVIDSFPVE